MNKATHNILAESTTSVRPVWFVTRSKDGAILGTDGRWMKQFSHVGDIKFYSTCGRAQRFGLGRVSESDYADSCGNLQSIGMCHSVYPGESVDICGRIFGSDGKQLSHRGAVQSPARQF